MDFSGVQDSMDHEKNYSSDTEGRYPSNPEDMNPKYNVDIGLSHNELFDIEDSSASSIFSSGIEYLRFSGPARRQNWSLPDTIIFYIAKNPSTPKVYEKLIRTCKYFFMINPIIICANLELKFRAKYENREEADQEIAVLNDTDDFWQIIRVKKNVCYDFDLKHYSAKIWIVESDDFEGSNFEMHDYVVNRNIVSYIIPKIYRCNVDSLELRHQNISFAEFLFLASSAIKIFFDKSTVKYNDDTVVPVEKIVECATKATRFVFDFNDNDASISSASVKNLIEIPHFTNLKKFFLENIPDSFDVEKLFVYLKEHKNTEFDLRFSDSISAAYKKRLEAIIDEIIEADGRDGYESPFIDFPGLDKEKQYNNFVLHCGLSIS